MRSHLQSHLSQHPRASATQIQPLDRKNPAQKCLLLWDQHLLLLKHGTRTTSWPRSDMRGSKCQMHSIISFSWVNYRAGAVTPLSRDRALPFEFLGDKCSLPSWSHQNPGTQLAAAACCRTAPRGKGNCRAFVWLCTQPGTARTQRIPASRVGWEGTLELVSFHPLHGQGDLPLGCSEPCPTLNTSGMGLKPFGFRAVRYRVTICHCTQRWLICSSSPKKTL